MEYKIKDLSYFLRYAYPCIEFWYKNKKLAEKLKKPWRKDFYKIVSPRLLKKLREIVKKEEKASKRIESKLEKLVPFAINFLKIMGKEKGTLVIDNKTIRNYFLTFHQKLEGSKKNKKIFGLCKIKKGKIVEVKGKYGKVKIGKEYRRVNLEFIKNPKVGEKVIVHFFYACEKI